MQALPASWPAFRRLNARFAAPSRAHSWRAGARVRRRGVSHVRRRPPRRARRRASPQATASKSGSGRPHPIRCSAAASCACGRCATTRCRPERMTSGRPVPPRGARLRRRHRRSWSPAGRSSRCSAISTRTSTSRPTPRVERDAGACDVESRARSARARAGSRSWWCCRFDDGRFRAGVADARRSPIRRHASTSSTRSRARLLCEFSDRRRRARSAARPACSATARRSASRRRGGSFMARDSLRPPLSRPTT